MGAMGCPNLLVDPSSPDGERGVLFSAIKGAGATQVRATPPHEFFAKAHRNRFPPPQKPRAPPS